MPHHAEQVKTIELESTQAERRGRFSRLIGRAAVAETESSFSIEQLTHIADKELQEFEQNWQTAEDIIRAYMDDPANKELMKNAILDYRSGHGTEEHYHDSGALINQRRVASRMSNSDLVDFVGAHVLRARLRTNVSSVVNRIEADGYSEGKDNISISDTFRASKEEKSAVATADLRWSEIKGTTCEHTPNAVIFFESVEKLGKNLAKPYKRSTTSSTEALEKIQDALKTGKELDEHKAKKLLDFVQDQEQLAAANPALLKLLASDMEYAKGRSVLGQCLELVKQKLETGALVAEFIDKQSEHNGGDNNINFLRMAIEDLSNGQSVDEYLASVMDKWPTAMARDYSAFAKSQFNIVQARVNEFKIKNLDKRVIPVDGDSVAVAMERLLIKVVGPLTSHYKGKAKITPAEALRVPIKPESIKQSEPLKPTLMFKGLKTKLGFEYTPADDDRLAKLKSDIVNRYPHDKRLADDIEAVIEELCANPTDTRGAMPLERKKPAKIIVDGKEYSVRRFNPAQRPGLSLGETGKQLRVIYAVNNGNLAILELHSDHDEYERAIKKY